MLDWEAWEMTVGRIYIRLGSLGVPGGAATTANVRG